MSMSEKMKEVRVSKIRLSVPLSSELYEAIKKESEALGISMSSYVAYTVGLNISSKNNMMKSLEEIMKSQLIKTVENK